MTGSQTFVLILLLGGAVAFAIFMMALGVYYWGRSKYEQARRGGDTTAKRPRKA